MTNWCIYYVYDGVCAQNSHLSEIFQRFSCYLIDSWIRTWLAQLWFMHTSMLIHTLRPIVPRIEPVLATPSNHCNATRLSSNIRRTWAYAERTLYMDKEKQVLVVVRQRHCSKARIFNHQYAMRTLNMNVINYYLPHYHQAISSTHDYFGWNEQNRRRLLDLNIWNWPYNITYDLNELDRIYIAMNVTI